MKSYHAITFALVLASCVSPEEASCGWMPAEQDTVTAGPEECIRVWTDTGKTRFIESGASACDGEHGAKCAVLRPGESVALVRPIQSDTVGPVHIQSEIANKNGSCRTECE